MGRTPCCDKNGLKKGPWTTEEDQKLIDYIQKHGSGNWRTLPKNAGIFLIFLSFFLLISCKCILKFFNSTIFCKYVFIGLQRCGKSCRLRWTNYLRPDIKRGKFSFEEEETIIHLHSILGNK